MAKQNENTKKNTSFIHFLLTFHVHKPIFTKKHTHTHIQKINFSTIGELFSCCTFCARARTHILKFYSVPKLVEQDEKTFFLR